MNPSRYEIIELDPLAMVLWSRLFDRTGHVYNPIIAPNTPGDRETPALPQWLAVSPNHVLVRRSYQAMLPPRGGHEDEDTYIYHH
jgi:hypothetical protein